MLHAIVPPNGMFNKRNIILSQSRSASTVSNSIDFPDCIISSTVNPWTGSLFTTSPTNSPDNYRFSSNGYRIYITVFTGSQGAIVSIDLANAFEVNSYIRSTIRTVKINLNSQHFLIGVNLDESLFVFSRYEISNAGSPYSTIVSYASSFDNLYSATGTTYGDSSTLITNASFNYDGTKLFWTNRSTLQFKEYSLSTPYNISTRTDTGRYISYESGIASQGSPLLTFLRGGLTAVIWAKGKYVTISLSSAFTLNNSNVSLATVDGITLYTSTPGGVQIDTKYVRIPYSNSSSAYIIFNREIFTKVDFTDITNLSSVRANSSYVKDKYTANLLLLAKPSLPTNGEAGIEELSIKSDGTKIVALFSGINFTGYYQGQEQYQTYAAAVEYTLSTPFDLSTISVTGYLYFGTVQRYHFYPSESNNRIYFHSGVIYSGDPYTLSTWSLISGPVVGNNDFKDGTSITNKIYNARFNASGTRRYTNEYAFDTSTSAFSVPTTFPVGGGGSVTNNYIQVNGLEEPSGQGTNFVSYSLGDNPTRYGFSSIYSSSITKGFFISSGGRGGIFIGSNGILRAVSNV